MTTIHIYDPKGIGTATAKLTPLPMPGLIIAAWNLLDQACDLVQPIDIAVSEPRSMAAITRWAMRFGGVLTSKPHQTDKGPQTWCRAEFDYYGITVTAYAHIPA